MSEKGYFGVGIYHGKNNENLGTLWRSAYILGASFVFTVGKRYKHQCTDTTKAFRHIPVYHYKDWDDMMEHLPMGCPVCALELTEDAVHMDVYAHPDRCVYLLGAEDHGIPEEVLRKCKDVVKLPGKGCYNVAVAGSLVMYDRARKERERVRGV